MGHLEELDRVTFVRKPTNRSAWSDDVDRFQGEAERAFRGIRDVVGRSLTGLETDVAGSSALIAALEAQALGFESRIAALEAAGPGTSGWEKIATTTHTGPAIQTLALLGTYDADADEDYRFDIRLSVVSGVSQHIRLAPRGVLTSANYDCAVTLNGVNQALTTNTFQLTGQFTASNAFEGRVWLSKRTGERLFMQGKTGVFSTTAAGNVGNSGTDQDTSNIMQWSIGSDVPARILAGSTVTTFKKAA